MELKCRNYFVDDICKAEGCLGSDAKVNSASEFTCSSSNFPTSRMSHSSRNSIIKGKVMELFQIEWNIQGSNILCLSRNPNTNVPKSKEDI
jgi:hypothetical protein